MKELLYKDFKLVMHPMVYVFALFGIMLLIPNYPSMVFVIYSYISFIFIFLIGRENKDVFFSTVLPVAKRDIVKSRMVLVMLVEVASLVIAIPFAILSFKLFPDGKGYGLTPCYAFFGLVLISFSIFNLIFIPYFYKTAHKFLTGYLVGIILSVVFLLFFEIFASFPQGASINDTSLLSIQLGVLFSGVIVFLISSYLTYRLAASNFEKVDL